MRSFTLGIGAFVIATAPALADDFASCRSIKDNLARLTCYDAAADKAPQDGQAAATKAGDLKADMSKTSRTFEDSKSPVDDSPQVIATDASQSSSGKQTALIVRCKEHRTEIFIAAQDFWGTSFGNEQVPVLYRVNNSAPVEQKWNPGHGSALASFAFFPDAAKAAMFLVGLPDTGKIFFRVTDFQGATHDMTFALDGIDEVRSRVGAACKWPPTANKSPAPK